MQTRYPLFLSFFSFAPSTVMPFGCFARAFKISQQFSLSSLRFLFLVFFVRKTFLTFLSSLFFLVFYFTFDAYSFLAHKLFIGNTLMVGLHVTQLPVRDSRAKRNWNTLNSDRWRWPNNRDFRYASVSIISVSFGSTVSLVRFFRLYRYRIEFIWIKFLWDGFSVSCFLLFSLLNVEYRLRLSCYCRWTEPTERTRTKRTMISKSQFNWNSFMGPRPMLCCTLLTNTNTFRFVCRRRQSFAFWSAQPFFTWLVY